MAIRRRREFQVSASLVRQEGALALFGAPLASLRWQVTTSAMPKPRTKSLLIRAVENAPDGFVVTTSESGHILVANRAFAEI